MDLIIIPIILFALWILALCGLVSLKDERVDVHGTLISMALYLPFISALTYAAHIHFNDKYFGYYESMIVWSVVAAIFTIIMIVQFKNIKNSLIACGFAMLFFTHSAAQNTYHIYADYEAQCASPENENDICIAWRESYDIRLAIKYEELLIQNENHARVSLSKQYRYQSLRVVEDGAGVSAGYILNKVVTYGGALAY